MKIYLDVSCLNRPYDDQAQERVRLEAIAVTSILDRCSAGTWQHVSSAMVQFEIDSNPDPERRRKARNHLPGDDNIIDVEQPVLERAKVIEVLGLKRADAVHVASAEAQTADVLLTCDDRFLRAAQRSKSKLAVKVANPVDWLEEQ